MMTGKIILEKYLKIRKGMKNVRNPHILRILVNFLKKFRFGFFGMSVDHVLSVTNLLKQHPSHMKSQFFFSSIKEVENGEGTKNVRIPHILRTISNF